MKRILIPFLFLISFSTFAQQVENVVATQQGTSVLVTYDLTGSPNSPYFVKLLMSKNGGQSFGQPLKYVTGDVGNTKVGTSKRIMWEAEKELSFYNGDAIFRVEATSLSAPMPLPVEDELGKLEVISAKQMGAKITIEFIYTPLKDAEVKPLDSKNDTYLIDGMGNQANIVSGRFGNSPIASYKKIIKGLSIKCKYVFDNIPENSSKIPALNITIYKNGYRYVYVLKNIPISK